MPVSHNDRTRPGDGLLFEHNPAPMFLFDEATLEILDTNNAASDLYGYSKEEFSKMTIADLRSEERIPERKFSIREPVSPSHDGARTRSTYRTECLRSFS